MACLITQKASNLVTFKKGSKMPKLKTNSSAAKRFSVTGTGKLKRNFANKRHCLFAKSQKMKRQARGTTLVSEADVQIVKKFLPYI
jgi:large subunit ribosomal protein L35